MHSLKCQKWPRLSIKRHFPAASQNTKWSYSGSVFWPETAVTEYVAGCLNIWIWFQIDEIKTAAFKGKRGASKHKSREHYCSLRERTSVKKRSAVSTEMIIFLEMNTFSNKINVVTTLEDVQPFKLLKTIFTPTFALVQLWCYLRQMPRLSNATSYGDVLAHRRWR